MADNWYIVLELEFEPHPVEDMAVINARIEEKRRFWSSNANHFLKGAEYTRYLEQIAAIQRDMADPDTRALMARQAAEQVYGPIDKKLKIIGRSTGQLDEAQVDKLAAMLKTQPEHVKKRALQLGIKIIIAPAVDNAALVTQYYDTKPAAYDRYNNITGMLAFFGVGSLYEFLVMGTGQQMPQSLPCADLLRMTAQRRQVYNKNDKTSSTGADLCEQCELAFASNTAKAQYDEYLAFARRRAVLDEAADLAGITGAITPQQYEDFTAQLAGSLGSRKLAGQVLEAFCRAKNLPYRTGQKDTAKEKQLKLCRCGFSNDVSGGRKLCARCGLPLVIACPACGRENDAETRVCACGFDFADVDRAVAQCGQAVAATDALDFEAAEKHLQAAKKLWAKGPPVEKAAAHLAQVRGAVQALVGPLRVAADEKRFYEADTLYKQITARFAAYVDKPMQARIEAALQQAGQLLAQARAATAERQAVALCSRAFEVCADYPGVAQLLQQYPPAPPEALRVTADGVAKENRLIWGKSPAEGIIQYAVVRGEGAVPQSVNDGQRLAMLSGTSYADSAIAPAVPYYYAVFALRGGVASRAAATPAAVPNLFEVEGLAAQPGSRQIQLMWDTIHEAAWAQVYRREAGGERLLAEHVPGGWLDEGLVNGQTYTYRVCLCYRVNGRVLATPGLVVSAVPTRPPKLVESLAVRPAGAGAWQLAWPTPGADEVRFYCSVRRPAFQKGQLVAQNQLEREMSRLAVDISGEGSGMFRWDRQEPLYVAAVSVCGGAMMFGPVARASAGATVRLRDVREVNGALCVFLDAPAEATDFMVLYRFDSHPVDIADGGAQRKQFTAQQLAHQGCLVLEAPQPQDYYITVYAGRRDGTETDWGHGADWLYAGVPKTEINYDVKVQKRLFGTGDVELRFEGGPGAFTLPALEVMSAVGVPPMFKSAAQPFCSIPQQAARGSVTFTVPVPKDTPKDTYIKPFLRDDALQQRVILKMMDRTSLKIS